MRTTLMLAAFVAIALSVGPAAVQKKTEDECLDIKPGDDGKVGDHREIAV
jgi:hypothetical protein